MKFLWFTSERLGIKSIATTTTKATAKATAGTATTTAKITATTAIINY